MVIIAPGWSCRLVNVQEFSDIHLHRSTTLPGLWALPGGQKLTSGEVRLLAAYHGWQLEGDELMEKKREAQPRNPWLGWRPPIEIQPFAWRS